MIRPAAVPTDSGRIDGRLPYYRAGDGPETLVVLPGLSDAFVGDPNPLTAAILGQSVYRGLTDDFTVWTVGRPRGLDDGTTTRDMAGAYSTVLDELDGGHVLGYSLGGLVAQHLAADYPQFVDRLVLGSSAYRLGGHGLSLAERWRDLAEAGEWGPLYASTAVESYVGWRKDVYPPLFRAVGAVLTPPYPDDVVVSCEACLDHDTGDRLGEISAPTLVLGGDSDRLFPVPRLRETKEGIPEATLALLDGAGHGVSEEFRDQFDGLVRRFLRGESLRGDAKS
jgi:pimeloyl-ACP methyl ester carboxylesterase